MRVTHPNPQPSARPVGLASEAASLLRASANLSPADIVDWLRAFPAGTYVLASEIAARLDAAPPRAAAHAPQSAPPTWREKLWTVAPETRLGVAELSEAIGRSADYVYRHTAPGGIGARLPHSKLDGALVFTVAAIRDWLRQTEIPVSGPQLRLVPRTTHSRQPLTHPRA